MKIKDDDNLSAQILLTAAELKITEYITGGNPYLREQITEVSMCKEFVDDLYVIAKKYLKEKWGEV